MRILKHELPIDDEWHDLDIKGGVVKVDWWQDTVTLWFVEHHPEMPSRTPQFKVVGTGHTIDLIDTAADGFASQVVYVGTALDRENNFAWHVVAKG